MLFLNFNEQAAEQNIFHQNLAAGPKTSEIWINLKVFDAKLGFGRHSCLVFQTSTLTMFTQAV